jgi:hypothetical protein
MVGSRILEAKWAFPGYSNRQLSILATRCVGFPLMRKGFMVDPVAEAVVLLIRISTVPISAYVRT